MKAASGMTALAKPDMSLYENFISLNITQLQEYIYSAETREEKVFYSKLLSLKMVLKQEKIIGKILL